MTQPFFVAWKSNGKDKLGGAEISQIPSKIHPDSIDFEARQGDPGATRFFLSPGALSLVGFGGFFF